MSSTPIQITADLKEYLQNFRSDLAKLDRKLDKVEDNVKNPAIHPHRKMDDESREA